MLLSSMKLLRPKIIQICTWSSSISNAIFLMRQEMEYSMKSIKTRGLYYLHSAGVLHRDLKPSNILIDSSCKIKICDFGLSRTLFKYQNQQPSMTQFIATRWYRAPEVLFGSKTYEYKSDMWSLGCVIYQIFAARPLLPGNDSVNQIEKVIEFKGYPSQAQMQNLKVQKIDVLLSHFKNQKNSSQRYYKADWSPDLIKLIQNLLQYSPISRWGPEDVLNCDYIQQFHNYEQLIKAKTPVVLRISDNLKNDKEFYRNFIHKFYLKKTSKMFERPLLRIPNRSESPKKYAETSLRNKKFIKNASSSLHSKNYPSKNTSTSGIFTKKSSKTIHCTSRTNRQQLVPQATRQSPGLSQSKHFSKNPSQSKQNKNGRSNLTLQERRQQKQNMIVNKKSGHRKLHKDVSKSIIKQQVGKKMLKRRAFVYL